MEKFDWDRKKVTNQWKMAKFLNAGPKVETKRPKNKDTPSN